MQASGGDYCSGSPEDLEPEGASSNPLTCAQLSAPPGLSQEREVQLHLYLKDQTLRHRRLGHTVTPGDTVTN